MKQSNPPRWAITFFRWFCNDHLADAVLGDLLEMYDRRRAKIGKFKADLLFIWNVIQFIQPFAIRRRSGSASLNNIDMIRNYFKIAWRNMSRQKMYTGITIGGFAIGLATCMIIFLFIRSELHHDQHYKDQSRVFRLYNDFSGRDADKWTSIQTPLVGVIKQELPDVELAGRLMASEMGNGKRALIRRDDEVTNTYEERIGYIDPEVIQILEVPMISGSAAKVLDQPYSMVLSRRKATQFFGDTNPVGKSIIFNDNKSTPYTITGVMEDYHNDSHFQYDFLLTLKEFQFWPGEQTDWCCWNYIGYVKLREGVNVADFETKLLPIRDNYTIREMEKRGDQSVDDVRKYFSFRLQPVGDIWLQPEIGDVNNHGSIEYLWLFGGIASFILVLACINFINLSTAKSANRAKEVGLRKVVGSLKRSLVAQFITESVAYSVISFVVALVIAATLLPFFNEISGRSIVMPWNEWWLLPVLIGASLLIGFIAGIYPALYLSAFKPIDVLKGNLSLGSKSSKLRSGMVVFQFATSIILIIGTVVVYRQMSFIMNRNVGYDKEQLMIIEGTNTLANNRESFKNELLKIAGIESVSISGYLPVSGMNREGYGFWKEGREKMDRNVSAQKWRVDADYIATMGMKLIDGRNFNRDLRSDSASIIVNQTMMRDLGLENPLGQRIVSGPFKYTIIGVIQDFNFASVDNIIRPLGLVVEPGGESAISARISSTDVPLTIQSVTEVWNRFMPNQPIRFSFLDEKFEHMYDDVIRTGKIFAAFATLAILVACLGLFALSAFMIEQRAKEISIRLVMGATTKHIFSLLTSNFLKLVAISLVIAAPLGWYGMHRWLGSYAEEYRTEITSDIFLVSGGLAVVIALVTVSYQSIKAALTKPVVNLRRE